MACGVSGPDHVWSCDFPDYAKDAAERFFAGVAAVHVATELRFRDDLRADQSRNAVVATVGYALSSKLLLQASVGVAFAGELEFASRTYEFDPGPTFAAGVAYRLLEGDLFLSLTGIASGTLASTEFPGGGETASYSAFDLRLGAVFGVTLFEVLRPYLVARAFGGPVFFRYRGEDVTGTDAYHVQLGAGVALSIVELLTVFVEGVPLGEQALSAGVTVAF